MWLSTDAGATWTPLMDAWDLDPTTFAADSLACGAIAVVAGPPDRIYVGSGEGDSTASGGPGDGVGYLGVGPIVSFDGGANWVTEPVAPGSEPLAGSAFFALAVDPADPDRVVAGTQQGLYRREPDGAGGHHWAQHPLPAGTRYVSSVVALAVGGATTFYAAGWAGPVYSSPDGATWTPLGTGFPGESVGRIALAVSSGDRTVVYALAAGFPEFHFLGLYRLGGADDRWREVVGLPATLFGADLRRPGQGWYDVAVTVDPDDPERVYVGGAAVFATEWSAALYRLDIVLWSSAPRAIVTHVGESVHPDIHALVFGRGPAAGLWAGCDGGVFHNPSVGEDSPPPFRACNTGLASLMMEHLGQHPVQEAVVFCASQDNGGQRFTGAEAWELGSLGDSGYQLVNWADPARVLSTYIHAGISKSTSGGGRGSYWPVDVPVTEKEFTSFYGPIAGTPPSPDRSAAAADLVAFGSERPWISTNFGDSWDSVPTGTLDGDRVGPIRALAFASGTRLWVGTTEPALFRLDRADGGWNRTPVDSGALPQNMAVTDIAVDPADASGGSVYVALGGHGDQRHVWHFDGTAWTARSGGLLDVQHNALVADPDRPGHLYAGADIGAWRSADGGATWTPFSAGLPDVAVMDLALHRPSRLLRAATHGRSVYERDLDGPPAPPVLLYVRNTVLDRGRGPAVGGLPDPLAPDATVALGASPDIRFVQVLAGDPGAPALAPADLVGFAERLLDTPDVPAAGLDTRVLVQVHNRGTGRADGVRVTLLAAHAPVALPEVTADDLAAVRSGTPISAGGWRSLGTVVLDGVHALGPRIADFTLDPARLPPAPEGQLHAGLLALVEHADDPLGIGGAGDAVSAADRQVAHRNVVSVQVERATIVPLRLNDAGSGSLRARVTVGCGAWPGRVRLHLPVPTGAVTGGRAVTDDGTFATWADAAGPADAPTGRGGPADAAWATERAADIAAVRAAGVAVEALPGKDLVAGGVTVAGGGYVTVFLELGPMPGAAFETISIPVEQAHGDALTGAVTVQAVTAFAEGPPGGGRR